MGSYKRNIEAEYEAVDKTILSIPKKSLAELNKLELAGLATILYNFYNGIENILKQLFKARSFEIPTGRSWHKELLDRAVEKEVFSGELEKQLKEYLAFRHFFSHSYLFKLQLSPMKPLIQNLPLVYSKFKEEINNQIELHNLQ